MCISDSEPRVTIGFGGYPSFAPLLVSSLFNVPFMIHEQNAFWEEPTITLACCLPETKIYQTAFEYMSLHASTPFLAIVVHAV